MIPNKAKRYPNCENLTLNLLQNNYFPNAWWLYQIKNHLFLQKRKRKRLLWVLLISLLSKEETKGRNGYEWDGIFTLVFLVTKPKWKSYDNETHATMLLLFTYFCDNSQKALTYKLVLHQFQWGQLSWSSNMSVSGRSRTFSINQYKKG